MKYIIEDIYAKYYSDTLNKYVVQVKLSSGEETSFRRLYFANLEDAKKLKIGDKISL